MINKHLEKLQQISDKNKEYIQTISDEINALEEALNKMCIPKKLIKMEAETEDVSLSYENKRLKAELIIEGKLISRPIIELPIELRIKAYNYLPVLLEKIWQEQISLINNGKLQ